MTHLIPLDRASNAYGVRIWNAYRYASSILGRASSAEVSKDLVDGIHTGQRNDILIRPTAIDTRRSSA